MNLTEFQKQLIRDIANEEITDFTSFLKLRGNLKQGQAKTESHFEFYQARAGSEI